MLRRDFLHASLQSTALALTLTSAVRGEVQGKSSNWIDAHVHVWTPDTEKYPLDNSFKKSDMNPTSFTPDQLFAHTIPEGVTRIVLIQMSYYRFDNSYMLDCIAKYPKVFSGVAIVDDTRSDIAIVMKDIAKQGVRGFRLYADKEKASGWESSSSMRSMWSYAADSGLSMCLLANPDALPIVDKQCSAFPKTRVVVDHFARIGIDGTIRQADVENLCKLARFENVYVKVSAYYALGKKKSPYLDMTDFILRLKKEFGANRLMWASDCPFQVESGHNYGDSIAVIRDKLEALTEADREWILRGTAEKVFFN